MKVRAKFYVQDIKHVPTSSPDDICAHIIMYAVYASNSGRKENETWSKYTPAGAVRMTITNPTAIDAFEIGKEYYLDFTPAD